jgi:hypothetical protein
VRSERVLRQIKRPGLRSSIPDLSLEMSPEN